MNENLNNTKIEIEINEISTEDSKLEKSKVENKTLIKDDSSKNVSISADKLYHTILKLKKNKLYYNLAIYMFFLFIFCMINFQRFYPDISND